MSPPTKPHRRAFTLVELLVVLGIITVLVSILLPAIARVREQANRVKCASNLRTIGQALTMYTQRYGYYPGGSLVNYGYAGGRSEGGRDPFWRSEGGRDPF